MGVEKDARLGLAGGGIGLVRGGEGRPGDEGVFDGGVDICEQTLPEVDIAVPRLGRDWSRFDTPNFGGLRALPSNQNLNPLMLAPRPRTMAVP